MSYTSLSEVLTSFRSRLADAPELDLVLDEKMASEHRARRMAHRGIVISIPSTENTGKYRDMDLARVQDEVLVGLSYRLRPAEFQVSLGEALDLEEQIRIWLSARTWKPEWHVTFTSAERKQQDEWWLSVQTFTLERDALLGG